VVVELARRNPGPEDAEFTADEIANALGESRSRADELMGTAGHLDSHLPGIRAALRDGTLSLGKARIIVNAAGLLDEAEARAAEAEVLDLPALPACLPCLPACPACPPALPARLPCLPAGPACPPALPARPLQRPRSVQAARKGSSPSRQPQLAHQYDDR
jgi:hypothetical protein